MQGNSFVCGARITMADILLFCFLDFAAKVGQPINPALTWVAGHHAMMAARPSAAA
jgi:glutathione S-transferase